MNEKKILQQVESMRTELAALRAEHAERMRKLDLFMQQADRQQASIQRLIVLDLERHAKLDKLLAEQDGEDWWQRGEQPPWT